MGWEPKEEEIPFEVGDLPEEAQVAVAIFSSLPDLIEGMNGVWLGKDFSGLEAIMKLYGVDGDLDMFDLIQVCVTETAKFYEEKRQAQETSNR